MKHYLVTGGAGFIGSHLVDALITGGSEVTVVDNFDAFYDRQTKWKNIATHLENSRFHLVERDIRDPNLPEALTDHYDAIVHLAAKAGVRPSILRPREYQEVNVLGTQNLLEFAKERGIQQFVFASSSSVYGVNPRVPWSEEDCVLQPISPYAATKVACELMGHVYSHLYAIRFLALRIFTVYGPRQRPDLAIHKFAKLLLERKPIPVYGDGSSYRDYTYVSDIVQGLLAALDYDLSPFEVINLGNNQTVSILEMIHNLEEMLGQKAEIEYQPWEKGDVRQTWADIGKAQQLLHYHPAVSFRRGLEEFSRWMTK
jgi:UDP-glucuronate 4-epimerase